MTTENKNGPNLTNEALLTPEEAAQFLATSERAIRRHWANRELAAVKVGRRVRFRRADLVAFIEANRQPAIR